MKKFVSTDIFKWLIAYVIMTFLLVVLAIFERLAIYGRLGGIGLGFGDLAWLIIPMALPLIIKETENLKDHRFFKAANPEIVAVAFLFGAANIRSFWLFARFVDGSIEDIYGFAIIGCIFSVFCLFYTGTVIVQAIRYEKVEFLKKSWLYKLFLFLDKVREDFVNSFIHTNISEMSKKQIAKFVIWHGVIVAIFCVWWFAGLILLVPYCFLMYRLLIRSFTDMKKQYCTLEETTKAMAEGDLDVPLPEDKGLYESVYDNLTTVKEGAKKAISDGIKSERMKVDLITNLSHDLKTPLTALITYIDLLKEEKDEEKRKEYLDILDKRSDRLKLLVEDLFEVTKATTGNIKVDMVKMDISNLVKQVLFEYKDRLKKEKLELVEEIPSEKLNVMADSQKTYRIYANLFGNIAKYSAPHTRVYVTVKDNGKEVVTTLKNISKDRLPSDISNLTERFVRGDESRNTEGSGLGLAIAKSFCDLQNAKLGLFVDGDLFKVEIVWRKLAEE